VAHSFYAVSNKLSDLKWCSICEVIGDHISENPIRHAREEYQCHDCSKTIRAGDLYYNRRTDFTILCMPCYEMRKARWLKLRDVGGRKKSLLADLRRGSWSAGQLHMKYGSSYNKWIRDLKQEGHPIWRRKNRGEVIYYLQEEEDPGTKCRLCGRLFLAGDDAETAKRKLCLDCLASQGIS